MFSLERFQSALRTRFVGRSFLYRPVTDSTMIDAEYEIQHDAPHGTMVLAEQQTAGQARVASRSWVSRPAGNLYFTFIVRAARVVDLSMLIFATPVAVAGACESVGMFRLMGPSLRSKPRQRRA